MVNCLVVEYQNTHQNTHQNTKGKGISFDKLLESEIFKKLWLAKTLRSVKMKPLSKMYEHESCPC